MVAIGLDLAWGYRRPSGIARLDNDGHLVEVASVRTDAEIVALIAPYVDDGVVVAIDAPLVVVNEAGNRPAERALNADFARFQAGCHPTNLRLLPGGSRGARLAAELGLTLDTGLRPEVGTGDRPTVRRAIEVYPHAATVALFGLPRTLKYKHKRGRTLDGMRAELLQLVDLLAGLDERDPPLHLGAAGAALRAEVATATTKAALRRAEDPVDAVVCAYVARLAQLRPAALTSYGDSATGEIVTPTLPVPH